MPLPKFSLFGLRRQSTTAKAPGKARNRILAAITTAGTVTGVAAMAVNTTGPTRA